MPSLYQIGDHFYSIEEFDKAFTYFTRSAQLNTETDEHKSLSLNKLGTMFRYGYGVPQNMDVAIDFYMKSAKLGNSESMFALGWIHQKGLNSTKDPTKAAQWYKQGALLGNHNCQLNLGCLYDRGKGVIKSSKKALYWFTEASKQGDIDATYNIGLMYDAGEYVKKDFAKAQRYYCDAGEYNLSSMINGLSVVKADQLKLCDRETSGHLDLNSMFESWIVTNTN